MNRHEALSEQKLNILLADDDTDECFFFKKALNGLPVDTHLTIVRDGEQLLSHLSNSSNDLPHVLFLDLNMPRKNGSECLIEIKKDPRLKDIPVVIYSTILNVTIADILYKYGAHYYIRKCEYTELVCLLERIYYMIKENRFSRPSRAEFVLRVAKAITLVPLAGSLIHFGFLL